MSAIILCRRKILRQTARIDAAEGSGAAKVLRVLDDYLVRTGCKVSDIFRSLSLRGALELSGVELEVGSSLIDDMGITRDEASKKSLIFYMHNLLTFMEKDKNSDVNVQELEQALHEFRELRLDYPSLGDGPMTLIHPHELQTLADYVFQQALNISSEEEGSLQGVRAEAEIGKPTIQLGLGGEINKGIDGAVGNGSVGKVVSVAQLQAVFDNACQEHDNRHRQGERGVNIRTVLGVKRCVTSEQDMKELGDKMMGWLQASRTFDRTPTGRMPTLVERMTDKQRVELELYRQRQ
ncbi:unnamed protein product, partial [Choristocarpus tenellus]